MNESIRDAWAYDEDGFFCWPISVQKNPRREDSWMIPPDCTFAKPAFKDQCFYRILDKTNNNSGWEEVPYPSSAAEFIGVEIPHQSRTPRNNERRKILRSLVEKEADRYREKQINNENGDLIAITVEAIPEKTEEEKAAQLLAAAKGDRAAAVSRIVVEVERKDETGTTVKVLSFDGDEEAQTRMSRTIVAAQALGVDLNTETRTWVMSDNSIEEVTIAELAEALRLAGDEQTALWTIPYTESE